MAARKKSKSAYAAAGVDEIAMNVLGPKESIDAAFDLAADMGAEG